MHAELATGASHAAVSRIELDLVAEAVRRRFGHDLLGYDRRWLQRRLERLAAEYGVDSMSGLQSRLLHDPDAINRLLTELATGGGALLAPPQLFQALRTHVIPRLLTYPVLRVWVPDSAVTAWSVALLLASEGLLDRSQVYATRRFDPPGEGDAAFRLTTAEARRASAGAADALGADDLGEWFTSDGDGFAWPSPRLARAITFGRHNLLTDRSLNTFHLVVCRGVLETLAPGRRARVRRLIHESLVPFGYLVLGSRDPIGVDAGARFSVTDRRARIYRALPNLVDAGAPPPRIPWRGAALDRG